MAEAVNLTKAVSFESKILSQQYCAHTQMIVSSVFLSISHRIRFAIPINCKQIPNACRFWCEDRCIRFHSTKIQLLNWHWIHYRHCGWFSTVSLHVFRNFILMISGPKWCFLAFLSSNSLKQSNWIISKPRILKNSNVYEGKRPTKCCFFEL